MQTFRILASRILGFFSKSRREEELDAELRAHLESLIAENIRRGMSPKNARQAAHREFGGVEQTKESYRHQRGLPLLESLSQDLRYGTRMLRKNPGFTLVAVFTLALGIGANSAAFSLVYTVLLRPLPYKTPERLFLVTETLPQLGSDEIGVSAAEYFDYRDRSTSFSQVAAYESDGFNLTGEGAPVRVNAVQLSASAFPLLGINPVLGRFFTDGEDRYGASRVAVLSNALWKDHYAANPDVIGKIVKLDQKQYTVVGVMPPSFKFPFDGSPLSERADLWVPEAISPARLTERVREFGVHLIGRLKPGITQQQAQADIEHVAADFMRQYPEQYSGAIRVVPRAYGFASQSIAKVRPFVFLLEAAVICVLLIACANVANLLLAKAGHRGREMAVRRAIGADRSRLLRQCLVESLVLSLLGGVTGIVFAALLIAGARRFGPSNITQLQDVTLNPVVILFTVFLSVATTLLSGIVPAWRLSGVSPQETLKGSSQIGQMRESQKLQNSLGIAEIAIALVLLIGGSLLLQSFVRLLEIPMGFRPEGAIVARTFFDRVRYPDLLKRAALQKELLSRLAALPGVARAAAASHLPLSDTRQIGFLLENSPPDDFHWAQNSLVSPDYFSAMGVSVLRGRDFSEHDGPESPFVAVVNEAFARQYLPGRDPIGQRFFWGGRNVFTIVGVASDVHISALDADPPPMIYNSMFQVQSGASSRTAIILRLANSEKSGQQEMFQAIQQQIWSLDKDLPLYGTTTLQALVAESVAQRRFTMLLMGGFAAIALLLAVFGLFGVISYLVAQRTRELAVRMALGAPRRQIGWMVLKQGAALGLAGCGIGLCLFGLSSPLFVASLYHINRFDGFTLTAVTALLLVVAVLAAYIPARRAMRVDPMVALRYE